MSMVLEKEQIQLIEKYLDNKELVQLDIRNEVLDHIANGIENSIEKDKISFENALKLEILKWDKALMNHSNLLLGLLYTGPRILITKCVKTLKRLYLYIVVLAFVIAVLLGKIHQYFNEEMLRAISSFLGYIYLTAFVLAGTYFFILKKSNHKTSYGFLFGAHFLGSCIYYIIYNPLFLDMMPVFSENDYAWILYGFHGILISLIYSFYFLYKAHLKTQKLMLA